MKRAKRWLAGLMGAVLLVSLLPAAALAEEDLPEEEPVPVEEPAEAPAEEAPPTAAGDPADGEVTLAEVGATETGGSTGSGTETEEPPATDSLTRAELAGLIYANPTLRAYIDEFTGDTPSFSDVEAIRASGHADAIYALARAGILLGKGDTGNFDPNDSTTRLQAAVVLWRALGRPAPTAEQDIFTDIPSNNPDAVDAVNYLVARWILSSGDAVGGDGCFSPGDPAQAETVSDWIDLATDGRVITRAELAGMLYDNPALNARITESAEGNAEPVFADADEISEFYGEYQTAIYALVKANILSGSKDGDTVTFHPGGAVMRYEAVVAIWRATGMDQTAEKQTWFGDVDSITGNSAADDGLSAAFDSLVAQEILTGDDVKAGSDGFKPHDYTKARYLLKWLDRVPSGGGDDPDPSALTRAELAEMIYADERLRQNIDDAAVGQDEVTFGDIADCTSAQSAAIAKMAQARVLSGVAPGEFRPEGPATRVQAAVVLWRATGCLSNNTPVTLLYTDQGDIPTWATAAINCLYALGILENAEEDFRPNAPVMAEEVQAWLYAYNAATNIGDIAASGGVSRAEMAAIFYEAYKDALPDLYTYTTSTFTDISDCTEDQRAVITLFNNLIYDGDHPVIVGYADGYFHPHDPVTKQQTAAILSRIIQYIEREAGGESGGEAAVSLASLGEVTLLDDNWYDDTLTFLIARGLATDSANEIHTNSGAPGIGSELEAWSSAVQPAVPTFSPAAGMYSGDQLDITITAPSGMTVYYTTDGSDPTTSSTAYTGPFTITGTTTVKAIAVKENTSIGLDTIPVVTAKYSLYTEGEGYIVESDGTATVFTLEGLKNAQTNDFVTMIVVGDQSTIEVTENITLTKELAVYGTLTIANGRVLTVETTGTSAEMEYANYWQNMGAFLHFTKEAEGETNRVRKMYGSREAALENLNMEGYDLFLVALCGGDLTLETSIEASTVLVLLTNEDGAGALTIADGTTVTAHEFGMPIEGSKLIVKENGQLVINDYSEEESGAAWVNGDVEFFGADPQIPERLEWNDNAYYTHLVALWYGEDGTVVQNLGDHSDDIWMTPLDEYDIVFAMMRYQSAAEGPGDGWTYEILSAESLDFDGLEYLQREDSERMFLTGTDWDPAHNITYTEDGTIYSLPVYSQLPDIGYYREPEVSTETYINGWDYSPISDNVFYLCVNPDEWFMKDSTYSLGTLTLKNGNGDKISAEAVEGQQGVWEITVTDCHFSAEYELQVMQDEETVATISNGIWIGEADEQLVCSDARLSEDFSDVVFSEDIQGEISDTLTLSPGSSKDVVFYLLRYDYDGETETGKWVCEYTDSGSIWWDDGITVTQAENSAACTVETRNAGTYSIGHLGGEWVNGEYTILENTERGLPLTVRVTNFEGAEDVSNYEQFIAALNNESVAKIRITGEVVIPGTHNSDHPLVTDKPIAVADGASLKLDPGAVMTSNVSGPEFYYEDSGNMWTHVAEGMAAYLLWYDAQEKTVFRTLYGSMPENLTAVMKDTTRGALYTAVFGADVTLTGDVSLAQLWVMNGSNLTVGEQATLTMNDPEYNKLHVENGDLTLEEGARVTVGGNVENESSLSMNNGNLTISKGAVLAVDREIYILRSEDSTKGNLIVQEGGTLTLENGGWVEGDVAFFGANPAVPEGLDRGGELYYAHLAACWDAENNDYSDEIHMTPFDWYDLTFFLMDYDADKQAWIYSPIVSEQLDFSEGLAYGPDENDSENLDRMYLKANDTKWNEEYSVSYGGYSLPVYIHLPDAGYYSSPAVSTETFLDHWDYSPLGENVFYLCVNPDVWFMQEHENWDLGLNIIYQNDQDSGISWTETETKGVWKITVEAPAFSFDIEILGTNEDHRDGLVLTGRGIWIKPTEQLLYSDELLSDESAESWDVDYDTYKDQLHSTLTLTSGISADVVFYLLRYDYNDDEKTGKWVCEYTNSDWVRGENVTVEDVGDGFCRVTAASGEDAYSIVRLEGEFVGKDDDGNDIYKPIEPSTRGFPLAVEVAPLSLEVTGTGGTSTSKTVQVENRSTNAARVRLVLAAYDADGRMCGVSIREGTLAANGGTLEAAVDCEAGAAVKAYLLDTLTSRPLCAAEKFQ
nr:S-layer homology domain-containing protein [uncultured Oscillibacter sp.]